MLDRRTIIGAALCAPALAALPAWATRAATPEDGAADNDMARFIAGLPKAEYHGIWKARSKRR